MEKYVVSSCLAGIECRYDCKSKTDDKIVQLVKDGKAITVCPEELGGLPTPRDPAEQINDKIITINGIDVTANYEAGAQIAFEKAKAFGASKAILKSKSPSCGCGEIYDGTFSGNLVKGDGVFAKLLKKNGIKVETENDS